MIENPIAYVELHQVLIDTYNSQDRKNLDSSYWSKEEVNPIRAAIKQHYLSEQEHKCCYCGNQTLSNHGYVWDVEHIVPKATHPHFLFEPKNLAVSCKDCNLAKSNARVLKNNKVVNYPRRSQDFLIVHPHYDDWDDHIRIIGKVIYYPKSKKGENTISICRLTRYAYEFTDWDSKLAGNEVLVDTFFAYLSAQNESIRSQHFSQLMAALKNESDHCTLVPETSATSLENGEEPRNSAEVA